MKIPEISGSFKTDENIILCLSDACEFLKTIPSDSVMLIVTSPPYNIGKEYETKQNVQDYLDKQKQVIDELLRVLQPNGSICWQVGNYVDNGEVFPLDIFYYTIFKEKGFKLRNRIIWYFGHGLHCKKRFSGRYETILWFTKGDSYKFNLDKVRVPAKYPGKRYFKGKKKGELSGNPLGKNPSDIWEFVATEWDKELWDIPNVKSNHPEKTLHPCQFPIELVERCILALTDIGDWVLDPYCGVGSSLVAGLKHKRRVIGCDREPDYVEVSKERILKFYKGDLKIRPIGKPVYVPTGHDKVSQIPKEWQTDKE